MNGDLNEVKLKNDNLEKEIFNLKEEIKELKVKIERLSQTLDRTFNKFDKINKKLQLLLSSQCQDKSKSSLCHEYGESSNQ